MLTQSVDNSKARNAVIAGFLGWTLDSFDFFILTFVIGDVAATFGKTRPDIALTITLALVTRPIGAMIFGMMADRMGRRIPLILNILLYSLLSVASGLAPDFRAFLTLRMLFGVALGGQWGVGASLALESVSVKSRGIVSGILQSGYAMGNLLAAIAYRTVYPAYGWRALFLLGGLPALLSLFVLARVNESPVWHEHRTQDWRAYARLALPNWKRFLYLVALMATVALISHGTQDMYPTFLQQSRHFTPQHTADITIASMISACLGSLFIGYISERVGRRRALVIAAVGGLVLVPLWIGAPDPALIVTGAVAMQFFVQGTGGVIPAQFNELTPGELRGFFPGLAYQLGIVCSSGITYAEAVLGEHFSYGQAMGILVAIIFAGAIFVFALGPEKKGASFAKEPQSVPVPL
jgi:SHS family lactate transporter-like MFS transporter